MLSPSCVHSPLLPCPSRSPRRSLREDKYKAELEAARDRLFAGNGETVCQNVERCDFGPSTPRARTFNCLYTGGGPQHLTPARVCDDVVCLGHRV